MKMKKCIYILFTVLLAGIFIPLEAQVKVTDGAVLTMDPNSLLELESITKGLLIPRMAINDLNLPAPLTAPVPTGMLIYSSGGTVPDGFYYWNGSAWETVVTQWITNGTSIYYNTGNVGIGASVPGERLEVNGNIKIGNATTGTIRATKELVLRQDGDVYGPSILRLRNRNAENGAIFETTDGSITLIDFIFKNALHQRNIRFESRAAMARTGAPSFHIGGVSPDNPTLSLGDNYAAFNKNVRIGDYTPPLSALDVNGQITLRTGASAGALLVSDANGTGTWKSINTINGIPVTKSASATLLKTESVVMASGDITLTLPAITIADDGLSITIKNVGTYTDLVTVVGNGSATIDGLADSEHTRWVGINYIANGGNWVIKNNINRPNDLFNVSETSSWTTIPEIIAYLNIHMNAPSLVSLGGEIFSLSATQTINLPYPVTFTGLSFGVTTISAASGFTGGLFSCATECYFKMLVFESTYGATSGHDAIRLTGPATYYEIKDCVFTGFNKGISITSNCDLWLFECDIENSVASGVDLATGSANGVRFRTSETDYINCGVGINLLSGTNAIISIINSHFYSGAVGQIGLNYVPASFTTPLTFFFTNNAFSGAGTFLSGFDFTLASGRDANFYIENNAGIDSKAPKCKINVVNNINTITLTTANAWYKADWTNTSFYTVKWLITNNKIQFQSVNTRNILIIVSGNVMSSINKSTITIGIVKNGVSTTRFGETTLRTNTANEAYQYSTTVYIQNVVQNDYFELYVSSINSGEIVTFQDVNIYANSQ